MREIHRLSARRVETAKAPRRLHDGGGLHLQITPRIGGGVAKSWELRYQTLPQLDGKRRWHWMGLGPFPDVSLARAREKAAEAREQRRNGVDPLEARARAKAERIAAARRARTLNDVFAACLADREAAWKGSVSKEQWNGEWRRYVSPIIGETLINDTTVDDIKSVVHPIWTTMPVLADRALSRIEKVIDYAIASGWRLAEGNPAQRTRLLLPKHSEVHRVEHYAAMAAADLPAFMVHLRALKTPTSAGLEFAILTATRSNEALGATWEEIDLANATWTVAGERMKGRKGKTRPHVVPLSPQAVALLKARKSAEASGLVFTKKGRRLSRNAFCTLLRTMKVENATPHGFRSTFSSWANDHEVATSDTIEVALAHKIGDETSRAYNRGKRQDPRRVLMQLWADFIDTGGLVDNVRELKRA
jgi:integrase